MDKLDSMNKIKEGIKRLNDALGLPTGLNLTFAYHCNRCDYLWFPKDFDDIYKDPLLRDIFNLTPPTACARCKSKYWKEPRKRKRIPAFPIPDNITNDGMMTVPRMKAVSRNHKRRIAQMAPVIAQLKSVKEQFDLLKAQQDKDQDKDKTPPVITIKTRKKKKKKEF